jgi:hypothetical protein
MIQDGIWMGSERLTTVVVAGLIAVGGLAACDDDEPEDAPVGDALTAEQLVSEARSVCREHNRAINRAAADLPRPPTRVEVRAFVTDHVLPEYSAWIDELDALLPPWDLAADWDAYIAASYAVRDAIRADPDLALDPTAAEFAEVNATANALGLGEECYAGPT